MVAMRTMCGVVVLGALCSVCAADAERDFQRLFGAEARKVTRTLTKKDDAAFAAKLFETAEEAGTMPQLRLLLLDKAVDFSLGHPSGCSTAAAALRALLTLVPDRAEEVNAKLLKVCDLQYGKARGPARQKAADALQAQLIAVADSKTSPAEASDAVLLYRRAMSLGRIAKSDRGKQIEAKTKAANARLVIHRRMDVLRQKLKKAPSDAAARRNLIRLLVVEYDDPGAAAKALTEDTDEALRTYVPMANTPVEEVPEAGCFELGQWYQSLAEGATPAGRANVLAHARDCYGRYLDLHTAEDVSALRARVALKKIIAEIGPGGAGGGPVVTAARSLTLDLGNDVKMDLVLIPAGTFTMGSPLTERGRHEDEGPQHPVVISRPFYLGITEVTQAQYEAVMGRNSSKFKAPRRPVECLCWQEAAEFCRRLAARTGKSVRLPTEAEWEYACRAGTTTAFFFGDDVARLGEYAWFRDNSEYVTHEVARKKPNPWGLYDMLGNVAEFCGDFHAAAYSEGEQTDPMGPPLGTYRTLRGRAFNSKPMECRSAARGKLSSMTKGDYRGFRVVVDAMGNAPAAPVPPGLVDAATAAKAPTFTEWPFDTAEARRRQKATAVALGLPERLTLEAGGVAVELSLIPGGTFRMGSPVGEAGREDDEGPQHTVVISHPFYLGVTEVTQAQFEAVTRKKPGRPETANHPARSVSWYGAASFCEILSGLTGKGVVLPTEAQWEYACRAGTATAFHNGDSPEQIRKVGWCSDEGGAAGIPKPVASFEANAWGLYDMHGNAREWCRDWQAAYGDADVVDPVGAELGVFRVVRGGGWTDRAARCRSADRRRVKPEMHGGPQGFRVCVPVVGRAPNAGTAVTGKSPDPPGTVLAKAGAWVDLLKLISVKKHMVRGDWRRKGAVIESRSEAKNCNATVIVPVAPRGSYEVEMRMVRLNGKEKIVLHLPVGDRRVGLCLSAMGKHHGLAEIDGKGAGANETRVVPGELVNGREHRVIARVSAQRGTASVEVDLDGKELIRWRGAVASLSSTAAPGGEWAHCLALRAESPTHFRSLRLKMTDGQAHAVAGEVPPPATVARPGEWVDMLKRINPRRHRADGTWVHDAKGLRTTAGWMPVIHVPAVPEGDYELEATFVRDSGNRTVGVALPTGPSAVTVHLSHGGKDEHLIEKIIRAAKGNTWRVKPGKLVNGKEYTLRAKVLLRRDQVQVTIELNDKKILQWAGPVSALSPPPGMRLHTLRAPAVFCGGQAVTFRGIRLRMLTGEAKQMR